MTAMVLPIAVIICEIGSIVLWTPPADNAPQIVSKITATAIPPRRSQRPEIGARTADLMTPPPRNLVSALQLESTNGLPTFREGACQDRSIHTQEIGFKADIANAPVMTAVAYT